MDLSREDKLSRLEHLQKEYNSLVKTLDQNTAPTVSQAEIDALKEENTNYKKDIGYLKEENTNCKKEIEYLKDLVSRLNDQLNRYLTQDGPLSIEDDEPDSGPQRAGIIHRQCLYSVNALLTSYDEVIQDQKETIQTMKQQSEKSVSRIKLLKSENEEALNYIEIMRSNARGTDTELDIKFLKDDRELMLKEISLLRNSVDETKKKSENKVMKLECLLRGIEEKEHTLKRDLERKTQEITCLLRSNEALEMELKHSVKQKDHEESIEKCSRFFNKLKTNYNSQASSMNKEVQDMKKVKSALVKKLSESSEHVKGISNEVVGFKIHYRKSRAELIQQSKIIKMLKKSRSELENKLKILTRAMELLIRERKTLLISCNSYKTEALKKSQLLGKLSLKLKEDNIRFSQRVAESEGKRQAAEQAWTRSVDDVTRLRTLLQAKDADLQKCKDHLHLIRSVHSS